MLASSYLKWSALLLVALCMVGVMSAPITGQVPQQPELYLAKDDPVISERFSPHLSKLEPQEKVKVWVFFTDKGFVDVESYRSAVTQAENALTTRAARRRAKTMKQSLVDFRDLQVNQAYIDRIMDFEAQFRHRSRWLNAASFEIPVSDLDEISKLSFVRSIKPVLTGKRKPVRIEPPPHEPLQGKGLLDLNYGASYGQLQQLNIPAVHNMGYYGQGVLVCMLDTGFRTDHQAFQPAYSEGRVLAEWDFVNNDGNTQNEVGDPSSSHNHGTLTWSALGGAASGYLYGPAYGADFIIAKTEDVSIEEPIEEDNWEAGMEWADSIGAGVISSSLAYIDWYFYSDMDGNTAVTTIAADIAAQLGIVVCNAMANAGPGSGTLHAPADADSIVACGAVYSDGEIVYFSSRGPTFDGRIKPEVCAQGVSTRCASASSPSSYTYANGTSLSTPLIGGAAAVILSAHPGWTPMQVREALMMSGDHALFPDNNYGWGVPDILAAIQYSFYLTGDVTGDEKINVSDVVFLVNYLYKEGPVPSPLLLGDVNCDDDINVGDVIYLVNYLYQGGTEPCSH
ncbi:MAG: S8 family serine peptidase [Candidatus Zixiibacteriota bacterium]